jgi:CotS family spore coat protein
MALNINAGVFSAFGLNVKKTVREKTFFICDTTDGLLKLARTTEPTERIEQLHTVKEHVAGAGYPGVDRYRVTPMGRPYAQLGGETWTACDYICGREADFESWDDVRRIIGSVRLWHSCARGVEADIAASPPVGGYFRKKGAELAGIVKRVRRQTRLSDFDVLLIKNIAFYTEQINKAAALLDESDYAARYAQALAEGHVCHHALKEESLDLCEGCVFITHYEEAAFDTQLADIAALVRRHVGRAGNRATKAAYLIEEADKAEPLPEGSVKVLHALLTFPWQFMKITTQYYSKKRTWTPNAIINRMQTVITEAGFYEKYINELNS